MIICINDDYDIKCIGETDDISLTRIEIDREEVFGHMSDFMILNYKYIPCDNGYEIYPSLDYNLLKKKDYVFRFLNCENKISILEAENETLKQELSITQDAVNELIFNSLNI